jgi:hypothetical protein
MTAKMTRPIRSTNPEVRAARAKTLLTADDRKALPPISGTLNWRGVDCENRKAIVRFYTSSAEWYAVEFDGKDTFCGLVDLGPSNRTELCIFSLEDLHDIGVCRDQHFVATTLSDVKLFKDFVENHGR